MWTISDPLDANSWRRARFAVAGAGQV